MVGKNNKRLLDQKAGQNFTKWSLRRLNVGVVSVAIASGFFLMGGVDATPVAKAATLDATTTVETVKDEAEVSSVDAEEEIPAEEETPASVVRQAADKADDALAADADQADDKAATDDKLAEDTANDKMDKTETAVEEDKQADDKAETAKDDKKEATTYATGDKDASGNTHFDKNHYAPNDKYSFSDIQFKPEEAVGETIKDNTLSFEMYGKHNIAASTSNWEIRLQIDERLAQYITKIEVDPKSGIGGSRRVLVRVNDSLGRPTSVWKVNYIRASSGLFAGAETTDTQVAPNGIITFEKNLEDILKEIGDDQLAAHPLTYRIYLISHKDNDGIIPGLESTGYFQTGTDENYEKLEESPNNPDQFKHGSINADFAKPNVNTSDNTGTTGTYGALVIDHKLTKDKNFSYDASAKGTPWNLNFKIDDRLIPYINGIELHMVNGGGTTYDVSYESGSKVADLSIERDPNKATYGYGTISDNDLAQNLVDFNNGSPRPATIRYVFKLNKPLNEILEELKGKAGVEGHDYYGQDFKFNAWLTDTNDKLIKNTYGTGFYYLQDLDGDGDADDNESDNKTNPYVGEPALDDVYDTDTTIHGSVYMDELAGNGHTVQLVTQDGTVLAQQNIDVAVKDGTPVSGEVDFTFTGVDASKLTAGQDLVIRVVSPGYDTPEEGTTVIKEAPKPQDKQTVDLNSTPDAKEAIKNADSLPVDATYAWKQAPDTSQVTDSTKGIVTVTIGNRTFDVEVEYAVVDNRKDAEKYDPEGQDIDANYGDAVPNAKDGIKNSADLPADAKYSWKAEPDMTKVGEQDATVVVTYADGTKDEVAIKVNITDNRQDAEKYDPEGQNIDANYGDAVPNAKDGIKNSADLPADAKYSWKAEPDMTKVGEQDATVVVTYADGTKDEVAIKVNITDNRQDAEKYDPEGQNIDANYGDAVPNAKDGIKNSADLPADAKYSWKADPDMTKVGEQDATVVVTYADGTKDEVAIKVNITDNRQDAEKYDPEVEDETVDFGGKVDLTDNVTNLDKLPEGTTVTDVTPEGTIDTTKPGDYTGKIEVEYPDGSKETVDVPVHVVDNRKDADKYTPEVEDETVDFGGKVDLTD
ncbi:MAG: Rib/alpha-like domain-containing protein, partial [Aerococcus sp.]|nr:Rib/alpha-like domain-containing protein [Aerococcus sp.]